MKIDLQDGFKKDTVIINVNGKEVFHKDDVSTRFQLGYALSVDLGAVGNAPAVEIILPRKNISHTLTIQEPEPIFLGVSLTHEGSIACRISHEPFGYV